MKKSISNDKSLFTFSPQSERLLAVVAMLRTRGTVKSDAEICRALNYDTSSFNRIRKGLRNITIDLLVQFCVVYRANPGFILFGDEPKLFDSEGVKKEIERTAKKFGGEEELESYLKRILKDSKFSEFLGLWLWHERVRYLANWVVRLEKDNVDKSYEIKTLSKIISDNMIGGNRLKDK